MSIEDIERNFSPFDLAVKELEREGKLKSKNFAELFIDRATKIRNYIIKSRQNTERAKKRWNK